MAEIESTVLDIIADKAKIERSALSRDTPLASLTLDSLDIVEIIFQIEEAFDISVPYNANEASAATGAAFATAGDVVDMVMKHVGQHGETAKA